MERNEGNESSERYDSQGNEETYPTSEKAGQIIDSKVPGWDRGYVIVARMHGTAVFTCNFITKMDHSHIGKFYTSPMDPMGSGI